VAPSRDPALRIYEGASAVQKLIIARATREARVRTAPLDNSVEGVALTCGPARRET
jgi:hypothetical protein